MLDQKSIEIFTDREKIRNQLIEYLKDYMELEDFDLSKSSYLSYLINSLSVLTANTLYFTTSVYKEFFITRAIQQESILNLASILGYTTPFARPARVRLLISVPLTFDGNVEFLLPKKTKYSSKDTIVFEQEYDVKINIFRSSPREVTARVAKISDGFEVSVPYSISDDNSLLYFNVDAVQQNTEEYEYVVPRLAPYEFYTLDINFSGDLLADYSTDISNVVVITERSDGFTELWNKFDSLFLIPPDVCGYSYRRKNRGIKIFFGNGLVGKQPKKGDKIKIRISTTLGDKGNVVSNSINRVMSKIYASIYVRGRKEYGNVVINVTNVQPASGGELSPNIDEIRSAALSNVSAAKRLVSDWDYRNFQYIASEFRLENSFTVMKRSDLKRNEIVVFTDLFYKDRIVPTRNITWILDNINPNSRYEYIIPNDQIEIDGVKYSSIFDIVVDKYYDEVSYIYYINNQNYPVSVLSMTKDSSVIAIPVVVNFDVIRGIDNTDNYLQITLFYQSLSEEPITNIECNLITAWNGNKVPMIFSLDIPNRPDNLEDSEYRFFVRKINIKDIPSGEQYFYFELISSTESTKNFTIKGNVAAIIKRDLSEFMYSNIKYDTTNNIIKIYDVPVVLSSYFNEINNDDIKLNILDSFINFNANSLKMLTDFVSIKLANTTGKNRNMLYNRTVANTIGKDPITLEGLEISHNDSFLVTEKENYWNDENPPFIKKWDAYLQAWRTHYIKVNECVKIDGILHIYNGEKFVVPVFDTPFDIVLDIWKDPVYAINDDVLIERIKEKLINTFYIRFGFDKPIYRSQLIKTVQSVVGVSYCQLLEPEHDIFFDYNIYKDFDQETLLGYTPHLVYFTQNSIHINIR